jgi:hypothetical protein
LIYILIKFSKCNFLLLLYIRKIQVIIKAEKISPHFVSIKDIPNILKQRGVLNNINLFIRSCYADIYDEINSNMSDLDHKLPNFAVIGTAGIGKSGFFFVEIYAR